MKAGIILSAMLIILMLAGYASPPLFPRIEKTTQPLS
jgi:hypothetical protein